jgi:hypothetical protein
MRRRRARPPPVPRPPPAPPRARADGASRALGRTEATTERHRPQTAVTVYISYLATSFSEQLLCSL